MLKAEGRQRVVSRHDVGRRQVDMFAVMRLSRLVLAHRMFLVLFALIRLSQK